MSGLAEFMAQQDKDNAEKAFRIAIENARNAMRAVRIAIEEGDTDEALHLIDEALGDTINNGFSQFTKSEIDTAKCDAHEMSTFLIATESDAIKKGGE